MKKFVIPVITAFIIGCVSAAFAQADEQNKIKTNPVQSGNIVIKLCDLFGYAGLESGDLYDNTNGKVIGVNDTLSGFYDMYFPVGTEINYFIIDGLAIGGSFHFCRYEFPMTGEKANLWSIGPSIYYYMNINNVILPYITVSYVYSKLKSGDSMDVELNRIPFGAGITMMAGKYIGFYGQATYNFQTMKEDGVDARNGRIADFKVGVKAFF